jgi:hypothetical protein
MKLILRAVLAGTIAAGGVPALAQADEIEDALRMALEAYQAGDIDVAKEEADYALQLMGQQKAAGLGAFLPEALPGWERGEVESDAQAAAMMGGGMVARTEYTKDQENVRIQFMADNQMVAAMGAMFGSAAMMGSLGQVKRIGRQKVVITQSGDLQAMIGNRIMVEISGSALVEDKEAYFAAIDVKALESF